MTHVSFSDFLLWKINVMNRDSYFQILIRKYGIPTYPCPLFWKIVVFVTKVPKYTPVPVQPWYFSIKVHNLPHNFLSHFLAGIFISKWNVHMYFTFQVSRVFEGYVKEHKLKFCSTELVVMNKAYLEAFESISCSEGNALHLM